MTPDIVFSEEHEFMMASLDGISKARDCILEIKCPGEQDHYTAAVEGKIPDKYYPQLQHQLSCAGLQNGFYFSFDGVHGVIIEFKRSDDYLKDLHAKEKTFWGYVQNFEAPPLTEADYQIRCTTLWNAMAADYLRDQQILDQIDELKDTQEKRRQCLIEMAEGENSIGGGLRLTKHLRKGSIEYKKIPELVGVNLESYRKDPIEVWRIAKE
jgi:hypothetical protein